MIKLIVILAVICAYYIIPIDGKGHGTCNDQCLTKTYCLSGKGSNICSDGNLVTAKWFVIPDNVEDRVGFTLTGFGVQSSDEKTISLTFQTSHKTGSQVKTVYSCYKSPLGATSAKVQSSVRVLDAGSSYYTEKTLSCQWSFIRSDSIYPLKSDLSVDLITDSDYQIVLKDTPISPGTVVASDLRELPIYHEQYLKCCNKVHGTDDFQVIVNQAKDDSYLLLSYGYARKSALTLRDSNGIELQFTCDPSEYIVRGTIRNQTRSRSISDQLYLIDFSSHKCSWSHPKVLVTTLGRYDTTDGVYDLQISLDSVIVYTEKGVSLSNSSSTLLSTTSIVIMIITFLVSIMRQL